MRAPALALALALLAGSALAGTPGRTYYVNPSSGSDANTGLSVAQAWQTCAKVSAAQFNPGDSILFAGGSTSACGLVFGANNRGTGSQFPLTVGAYGSGAAIFTPGTTALCISVTGAAGYALNNLTCTGVGLGTSTVGGVAFLNPYAGITQLDTVSLSHVTITGFKNDALALTPGAALKGGFKNVTISDYAASANGGSAVNISADGAGQNFPMGSSPSFANVLIDRFVASNDNFDELYLASISGFTVQGGYSAVNQTGNGWYANDVTGGLVQFGEIAGSTGFGLDLDLVTRNTTAQYLWIHNAAGNGGNAGLEVCACGTAAITNITLRFNLVENTSQVTSNDSGDILIFANVAGMTGINVYNNVVFENNNYVGQGLVWLKGTQIATLTGTFANNILYAATGVPSVIDTQGTTPPAGFVLTGNDYYMPGGFQVKWGGSTYASFSAWQTATGVEKISGSNVGLTSNPLLTSPGNGVTTSGYAPALLTAYQLQAGSPMIGAGVNLSTQYGISLTGVNDYYGAAAIGPSGYDVGAHSR